MEYDTSGNYASLLYTWCKYLWLRHQQLLQSWGNRLVLNPFIRRRTTIMLCVYAAFSLAVSKTFWVRTYKYSLNLAQLLQFDISLTPCITNKIWHHTLWSNKKTATFHHQNYPGISTMVFLLSEKLTNFILRNIYNSAELSGLPCRNH